MRAADIRRNEYYVVAIKDELLTVRVEKSSLTRYEVWNPRTNQRHVVYSCHNFLRRADSRDTEQTGRTTPRLVPS